MKPAEKAEYQFAYIESAKLILVLKVQIIREYQFAYIESAKLISF